MAEGKPLFPDVSPTHRHLQLFSQFVSPHPSPRVPAPYSSAICSARTQLPCFYLSCAPHPFPCGSARSQGCTQPHGTNRLMLKEKKPMEMLLFKHNRQPFPVNSDPAATHNSKTTCSSPAGVGMHFHRHPWKEGEIPFPGMLVPTKTRKSHHCQSPPGPA